MLGVLIVFACGTGIGYAAAEWGTGWGIVCGLSSMLILWVILGLFLRSRMMHKQTEIQEIMGAAQNKINRQIEMFQRRRQQDMNMIRQSVEKIQFDAVRKALQSTEECKKYYIWNPMLDRQINVMKIQLYYQLREYSKVDELLPKTLLMDPQSIGIKLARMYKNNDPKLDKFFNNRCRRIKGDNGAFIASVYAWIKLKQQDTSSAMDALLNAAKSSDNQALTDNIARLSNGKVKHFSNSGFGDMWYALALEEPKVKRQQQSVRGF